LCDSGFNDNLPIQEPIGCGNPTIQQTDPNIESLNAEIARLRQENEDKNKIVVELQERIKELEALQPNEQVEIQINQPESELTPEQEIPHSRQRGNVRKIIAVLVDMARLPSEPYTAFNMLDAHAQANGMELPSKDTTTKWTHNSS
jgi:TolA-binding protein